MIQKIYTILLSFQNNYNYWSSIEDLFEKRGPVFQDRYVYSSSSDPLNKAPIIPPTTAIVPNTTPVTKTVSACKI